MQPRISADELALRVGVTPDRVRELADRDVLERDADGRFDPGDVHRIRLLTAFGQIGVPLDAMRAASREGRISLRYYDELHPPPRPLSGRTYGELKADLGDAGDRLTDLFAAFGLAEPASDGRLEADEEALLTRLLEIVEEIGRMDLALRAVRLLAEGARRAGDGALGVYAEAVDASDEALAGLPLDELFDSRLRPWSRFARQAPDLAAWLTSRHLSRAIDDYSVTSTERILEDGGYIPTRVVAPPAVAFVDLTGFTRLTEELGDEAAAGIALRLGTVAAEAVAPHGGRLVKLLGDGVLIAFPEPASAIDGTLDLLAALGSGDLPGGHAGVAWGPIIVRDNDVFGRTVNLAARIADLAPDGELYLPAALAHDLEDAPGLAGWQLRPVEATALQGIGATELVALTRARVSGS
jgi:adenylate cyclase